MYLFSLAAALLAFLDQFACVWNACVHVQAARKKFNLLALTVCLLGFFPFARSLSFGRSRSLQYVLRWLCRLFKFTSPRYYYHCAYTHMGSIDTFIQSHLLLFFTSECEVFPSDNTFFPSNDVHERLKLAERSTKFYALTHINNQLKYRWNKNSKNNNIEMEKYQTSKREGDPKKNSRKILHAQHMDGA